ncbi:hypothetical protein ACQKKK_10485 [Peribacillus sp. NPDC006672]|uniref:hypothetical protein n=1 Tax=Peribacillus sp. NPDC006672 TaxID=3390606 RepID=UPI003D03EDE1
MEKQKIAGLSMTERKAKDPLLKNLIKKDGVFCFNPNFGADQEDPIVQAEQVKSAEDRLDRFVMDQYLSNS